MKRLLLIILVPFLCEVSRANLFTCINIFSTPSYSDRNDSLYTHYYEKIMAHLISHLGLERVQEFKVTATILAGVFSGDYSLLIKFNQTLIEQRLVREWLNSVYAARNYPQANPAQLANSVSWKEYKEIVGLIPVSTLHNLGSIPFTWINDKSLRRHFNKRDREDHLPITTPQDYILLAESFIKSIQNGDLYFKRSSDTVVKYRRSSNELAIFTLDGKIITYYILDETYRSPEEFDSYLAYVLWGIPYSSSHN